MNSLIGRIPVLDVSPLVDCGRKPAKAVAGETFQVSATVFREGHDAVAANVVLTDPAGRPGPFTPMRELAPGTDRWGADVTPTGEGRWTYHVEAWSDPVATWRHEAGIKIPAGIDTELVLAEGAALHERAAEGVPKDEGREAVLAAVDALRDVRGEPAARLARGAGGGGPRGARRPSAARTGHRVEEVAAAGGARAGPLRVVVRDVPASEGAYVDESTGRTVSGTLRTAAERLPAIAAMGFDVVYLPPIHPIGTTHRKGPNNGLAAGPGDPGVPWAIGSADGGHDAVHPELGTIEDFDAFVARARELRMEVALDFALQCSPDHPWVKRRPAWFHHRADGSIAYAENPPKKYQDIYPIAFDKDMRGLVRETVRVLRHWMAHGVRIFRVDNPHTKPVVFWQKVIAGINRTDPT